MPLRLPTLSLQNLCRKKSQFNLNLALHLESKYKCSSSPNIIQSLSSKSLKNIQFPKYVQPLINQSVDEILSSINSESVTPYGSVSILKALRMHTLFKNIDSTSFTEDKNFKTVCQIFERNCCDMKPSMLVSGLRSLLEVGVPFNSSCVVSAEQNIIKNIHLFSSVNIITCLYFHHKFLETELQKEVVSSLVKELCCRASEITSGAEILMLVHFLKIFNEEDQKTIQQKIIELIPCLNIQEMCKVLNTLSENSNRNIFILNAISFYLRQKAEVPDVKEVIGILYSFKTLNFCDQNLLAHLMRRVVLEIASVEQPTIISGLLTVCGHLRLGHQDVLSACGKWITTHLESCRLREFVSYILTVATVNYNNEEVQNVLRTILPFVKFETIESPNVWLDVVWSLAVLNIADKDILLQVLSPKFYKPLIDSSDFQTVTNKLKLMNLKATLKMLHPECIFGCDLFLEPAGVPQSSSIESGRKHIIKVLNNFIPKDKYICTNQNTDMGIFIDAEFIMDKNIKPLPISEFGLLMKPAKAKPLPIGCQRIALLTLFYKDYSLHSLAVTGCNSLAARLLSAQGYTVVQISFEELIRNNTEVKKAMYLLQRIQNCMKKMDYKVT